MVQNILTELELDKISYSNWKQSDLFPLIFDHLCVLSIKNRGWIFHQELVSVLKKDIEYRNLIHAEDVISNTIAWFSQKITEYENGNLSPNYPCYDLIQEAYRNFDRCTGEDGCYSYKLKSIPAKPVQYIKRVRGVSKEVNIKLKEKQVAFSVLVKELKQKLRYKLITPEQYRQAITEFNKSEVLGKDRDSQE